MKPEHIILEGVTGSVAYGLNTKDSDEDIKGVYLLHTNDVLKLGFNPDRTTKDHVDPDWVYHELQKFMKLAVQANPTILELLFLDEYRILDEHGKMLVKNREAFLSNTVYHSYGGYALSQARKLNSRDKDGVSGYSSRLKNRYAKHTRHTYRLLWQGKQLLETGTLTVKVPKDIREELFWLGEQPVDVVIDRFEQEFKDFDKIKSVLPDKPDIDKINQLLLDIRRANLFYPNRVPGGWITHGQIK